MNFIYILFSLYILNYASQFTLLYKYGKSLEKIEKSMLNSVKELSEELWRFIVYNKVKMQVS